MFWYTYPLFITTMNKRTLFFPFLRRPLRSWPAYPCQTLEPAYPCSPSFSLEWRTLLHHPFSHGPAYPCPSFISLGVAYPSPSSLSQLRLAYPYLAVQIRKAYLYRYLPYSISLIPSFSFFRQINIQIFTSSCLSLSLLFRIRFCSLPVRALLQNLSGTPRNFDENS